MFSLAPYSLLMRGLTFPIFIWEVQNNLLPMVVGHPSRVVQISNKYIFFHCLFYSAYRIMSKMIIKREQKWLPCSNLSKIFKPKTKILYSHPPIVQNTVKVRFSVCVCVCLCVCVCVCVCVYRGRGGICFSWSSPIFPLKCKVTFEVGLVLSIKYEKLICAMDFICQEILNARVILAISETSMRVLLYNKFTFMKMRNNLPWIMILSGILTSLLLVSPTCIFYLEASALIWSYVFHRVQKCVEIKSCKLLVV